MNIEYFISVKKALENLKENKATDDDKNIILEYISSLEDDLYRESKTNKVLIRAIKSDNNKNDCSYHTDDYDFNK